MPTSDLDRRPHGPGRWQAAGTNIALLGLRLGASCSAGRPQVWRRPRPELATETARQMGRQPAGRPAGQAKDTHRKGGAQGRRETKGARARGRRDTRREPDGGQGRGRDSAERVRRGRDRRRAGKGGAQTA